MSPPAVVIRSTYAGREPVSFASVQVFAPGQANREFQAGHTDRRGTFSFVPDGPGPWRVVVDDEEGHRRDMVVTIPEKFGSSPDPIAAQAMPISRWERALTGLALIFGATGILYGFKSRRGA
jgi:nickel transport protein